jgi:hypothetical protein
MNILELNRSLVSSNQLSKPSGWNRIKQLKKQSEETRTALLSADICAFVWKDFLDYIFFTLSI